MTAAESRRPLALDDRRRRRRRRAARRSGSGLAGLQDRVAALDGTLTVDSPPGGGTRVSAEIPVACASSDSWGLPHCRGRATGPRWRHATAVLIVDDDPGFRERCRRACWPIAATRSSARRPRVAQARVAIAEARPDAVLLDVNLPDGDGIVFAQELTGAGGAPRVLLTSSDAGAAPRRLLERCGAAGFVAKVDLRRGRPGLVSRLAAPEELEHGQHAPVVLGHGAQAELAEDARDVALDGRAR